MPINPSRIELLDAVTLESYRRMSSAQTLEMGCRMWTYVRDRAEAAVRWQYPTWTDQEVRAEVSRRLLEDGSSTTLVTTLERLQIPYAIGGSHATMAYGRPRNTLDIDVVVELTPLSLKQLAAEFPFPDFYTSEEGARSAVLRGGTFNIIHPDSGQKIDFFVPG